MKNIIGTFIILCIVPLMLLFLQLAIMQPIGGWFNQFHLLLQPVIAGLIIDGIILLGIKGVNFLD